MDKQTLLKKVLDNRLKKGYNPDFTYQGFSQGVLSNWAQAEFTVDGVQYKSAEQYYMVLKAEFFNDTTSAELIKACPDAKRAHELGRMIAKFDKDEWDKESGMAMYNAVLAKFEGNAPVRKTLLETGEDILVYCNSADLNWGAGIDMMDKRLSEPFEWPGDNRLGFVLMEVRDQINMDLEAKDTP